LYGALAELRQCRSQSPSWWAVSDPLTPRLSFREQWGDLFYSLADLILQAAAVSTNPVKRESLLHESRQVMEQLKAAELAEYVDDECLVQNREQLRSINSIGGQTAVIYVIVFPHRCDLLLTSAGKIYYFSVPVGAQEFDQTVATFRRQLETRTRHDYLQTAGKLYSWLIAPWETRPEIHTIDTLIFVPDASLASIPLGALHDGERFLIERYAISMFPGLTMDDAGLRSSVDGNVLLCGLTDAVQGYEALPFIVPEMEYLNRLFPHSQLLLNDTYCHDRLATVFSERIFSIIHIATHGEFAGDTGNSFLLTYDDKISIDDMENLIRPLRRQGNPIELLTLSACQTAAGDDRATLGLAGMAYKSGARSVLATLWYVNDEVSSILMPSFYRQFIEPGRHQSKAEILRQCQVSLLKDTRFRHPCYWAPYILIGNWQ
jgi:CHAT domain-containing protein